MELLCEVCDRLVIENESKYYEYLTTLPMKNDKSLYEKFTNKNVDLDEVNKILNCYISTQNKFFFIFLFVNL